MSTIGQPQQLYGTLHQHVLHAVLGEIRSAPGPAGPTGPEGPPGPTGPQGPQGPQGLAGPQGTAGTPGVQGVNGASGVPGPQGIQGEQGDPGTSINLKGSVSTEANLPASGAAGDAWLVADTGELWVWTTTPTPAWHNAGSFPEGPPGIQGPQGVPGAAGPAGPQGVQGASGAQGVQGPQGLQGIQGPQGTGIALKGTVATVGALPPTGNKKGDAYLVSSNGHMYVWSGTAWVDAGPVQGPAGPTGPQGPQGIQGAAGAVGAQGVQGVTGPQGPTGAASTVPGPPGPPGPAGPVGGESSIVGFIINSGATGANVGPMLPAPRAASFTQCVAVTKTSDAVVALQFTIKKNGVAVFASPCTIAAATVSGTVATFTPLSPTPLPVTVNDVFTIDIVAGSATWQFTAQLE